MVSINKTVNPIHTYSVVPQSATLVSILTKVLNTRRKISHRKKLSTIKIAQSNTIAYARFLSNAPHSVSQDIMRAQTDKLALYNKSDTVCRAESRASEYMFPDYSTFKTYGRLYNNYATLGDLTKITIEEIGTLVYTLNIRTILTRNALHIPALHGPLYSLCKHRQIPGCGVYSSYKDFSYLFLPDFILQVEYSYDKIFSYHTLGQSHQVRTDYI